MRCAGVCNYSSMMKFLHWLIGLTVIAMLLMGFFLDDIPKAYKGTAYMLHKSTGITLLILMLIRLVVVFIQGKPQFPASMSSWEKSLSTTVQFCFYVFLILMPLSGWIMSVAADKIPSYFNLFQLTLPGIPQDKALAKFMNQSHEVMAWILSALVILHILGALKHHYIDKDDVLRSMLPGKK
jgi:cytochrome b561